jgi:hypothetical protein
VQTPDPPPRRAFAGFCSAIWTSGPPRRFFIGAGDTMAAGIAGGHFHFHARFGQ